MKLFLSFSPIKNKNPFFFIVFYDNIKNRNYLSSFNNKNVVHTLDKISPYNLITDYMCNLIQNKPLFKNNFVVIMWNYIKPHFIQLITIILFNLKWLLIAILISSFYFFCSLFYLELDFTKQVGLWFIVIIFFYLLINTFNNLLNKYKYGKFTSAIQRFWKRTGMIFWLIEGFLFLLFFYYFLNSSQEPLYMYDYSNLNQEFLIGLKSSFKNMILISVAIYFSFILILNNNYLTYYQNVLLLSLISLIIFYTLYVESYQFIYIILKFSEKTWIFNEVEKIWILEFEQNIFRTKQQYFILCLIAKYWHFIFIFISWFFFLIKCFEVNKINYTLMGYNIQNLIILYILNLLCLVQWAKELTKKFLEITYYWFHVQYDEKFFISIQNEIINVLYSVIIFNTSFNLQNNLNLISTNLFYTNELNIWKYINCI